MATAIEFNHVSKQYRLGLVSTRTLSHDLDRWFQTSILRREDPYLKIGEVNDRASKGSSEYVWALRDIDFKVEQGDVVGIIGKNGAGKSTLLKLLSKVTAPTIGTIRARGRIASLLEVGTGFHQEMTGRENIYMNGAILGMTKQEMEQRMEELSYLKVHPRDQEENRLLLMRGERMYEESTGNQRTIIELGLRECEESLNSRDSGKINDARREFAKRLKEIDDYV